MARRGRPKKTDGITIKSDETRIFIGFVLLGIGLTLLFNNTLAGALPRWLNNTFGANTYTLGAIFLMTGLRLIGLTETFSKKRITGAWLLLFTLAPLFALSGNMAQAGSLGQFLHSLLYSFLGNGLEITTLVILMLLTISLISNISLAQFAQIVKGGTQLTINIFNWTLNTTKLLFAKIKHILHIKPNINLNLPQKTTDTQATIEINTTSPQILATNTQTTKQNNSTTNLEELDLPDITEDETPNNQNTSQKTETATTTSQKPQITMSFGPDLKNGAGNQTTPQLTELEERFYELYAPKFTNWKLPPLSLFEDPTPDSIDTKEVQEKSRVIEETLASFRVQAKVAKIVVGPTVIQYALNLATGTKVAKVKNLAKDIGLALAAPSDSIRIDTIAGTSLVGIEVPRKKPHMVRIKEILQSDNMHNPKNSIPLAIGKNIHGESVVLDLFSMPHMLIAGATGTGKSVTLNDILTGFLVKFSPDELKLILVDPKMVEMELYNGLPHLLVPVITNMDKVVAALDWLITEMQLRYQLFKEKHVRNIKEYNKEAKVKLPYIVLVIDEMADLILTKRAEVEQKIVRLAQLARATGIHLILATQRPSVNVITGLIKANIPARIALGVTSNIDSRVIIDQSGAENLLGKGDMLVKTPNSVKIQRVQGAFVDTKEIEKLANSIKTTVMEIYDEPKTFYINEIVEQVPTVSGAGIAGGNQPTDPLLKQAIQLVLEQQRVSASALQRYLRIGFNRAARLIDQMEAMGVISPRQGNKREILISSIDELNL